MVAGYVYTDPVKTIKCFHKKYKTFTWLGNIGWVIAEESFESNPSLKGRSDAGIQICK